MRNMELINLADPFDPRGAAASLRRVSYFYQI
jgi:hypothetical protein